MEQMLVKLVSMSATASYLAVVVLLLHLILKKAPRSLLCGLWALVGIRLVCPFTVESVISLIPKRPEVSREILSGAGQAAAGGTIPTGTFNGSGGVIGGGGTLPVTAGEPGVSWITVLTVIWLLGAAAMLTYGIVCSLRLKKKVAPALCLEDNIYICDYISTPFIFGIRRPRIYLPSGLDSETAQYVLAHERAHLRRRDHWWKPLGYLLLALHWFNPVLWLSYVFLCRDIEMACDERVVKDLDDRYRKAYSRALLSCSVPRRMIAACPLAFGEVGVKERVKTVLNYKKPGLYMIVLCLAVCVVTAGCFLTDPKTDKAPTVSPAAVSTPEEPTAMTGEGQPLAVKTDPEDQIPEDTWQKNYGPQQMETPNGSITFSLPQGWLFEFISSIGYKTGDPERVWDGLIIGPIKEDNCRIELKYVNRSYFEKKVVRNWEADMESAETTLGSFRGTVYYPAGSDQWRYITVTGTGFTTVVENQSSPEAWKTWEESAMEILGSIRLPYSELPQEEIIRLAEEICGVEPGCDATALPDYKNGCWIWTVTCRPEGEDAHVVCLDMVGNLIEHHREHTEETHHAQEHHEEEHHGG